MQSHEKVSVTLTPEMHREVRDAVQNGDYASTSEALLDAVRTWQRQRSEDAERITGIRARVHRSLDDPKPDLDEEEVDRYFAARHAETVKSNLGAKT